MQQTLLGHYLVVAAIISKVIAYAPMMFIKCDVLSHTFALVLITPKQWIPSASHPTFLFPTFVASSFSNRHSGVSFDSLLLTVRHRCDKGHRRSSGICVKLRPRWDASDSNREESLWVRDLMSAFGDVILGQGQGIVLWGPSGTSPQDVVSLTMILICISSTSIVQSHIKHQSLITIDSGNST